MARLAGLIVSVAVVAGCGIVGPGQSNRATPKQAMSPQIAYVGSDDQIYVAEADGSSARAVTRQVTGLSTDQDWVYRWPTYSPDGKRLAFAGYRTAGSQAPAAGPASAAVLVADVGSATTTGLLESASLATIYLSWSADSRHLAALLQHG